VKWCNPLPDPAYARSFSALGYPTFFIRQLMQLKTKNLTIVTLQLLGNIQISFYFSPKYKMQNFHLFAFDKYFMFLFRETSRI